MSGTKEHTLPDGRKATGTPVEITSCTERWSDITLSDGTRLKMKPVVVKVERMSARDANGLPIYAVTAQNFTIVESAEGDQGGAET